MEPNVCVSEGLKTKLCKHEHLAQTYVTFHAALEDHEILGKYGTTDNSVDTVVCMQILCSVPDPVAAAKTIHKLLKPGGQLLFWEHRVSTDIITNIIQREQSLIFHANFFSTDIS